MSMEKYELPLSVSDHKQTLFHEILLDKYMILKDHDNGLRPESFEEFYDFLMKLIGIFEA